MRHHICLFYKIEDIRNRLLYNLLSFKHNTTYWMFSHTIKYSTFQVTLWDSGQGKSVVREIEIHCGEASIFPLPCSKISKLPSLKWSTDEQASEPSVCVLLSPTSLPPLVGGLVHIFKAVVTGLTPFYPHGLISESWHPLYEAAVWPAMSVRTFVDPQGTQQILNTWVHWPEPGMFSEGESMNYSPQVSLPHSGSLA